MTNDESQPPSKRPSGIWTSAQTRGLRLFLVVLAGILIWQLAWNRSYINDPQPQSGARAGEVADRLDPNTASWQELSVITGLGEKRAHAIVAYREQYMAGHHGERPFHEPHDLQHIKGIGPATAANMTPYLIFPSAAPGGKK